MINIRVTINGIVMYCDESICSLDWGNGYSIQKMYLEDLPFKNKIVDGDGNLDINYMGSQLDDDKGTYFICLHKETVYQIQGPQISPGVVITDRDILCEKQLSEYNNTEMKYLVQRFSLLHLFKKGNIGYKEMFFEYTFQTMGQFDNTQKQTSNNITRNIVDKVIFTLSSEEALACNQFLQNYSGIEYNLLENCIDKFTWGLERCDEATGFEQYTTVLEMLLLGHNQEGKKEVLAKRVSVLLETDPVKIKKLYDEMKNFYRYRSESLHEGDGRSITVIELKKLEEIVRFVLKKYLYFCKVALIANPESTWGEIKASKINDLKNLVMTAKTTGILPA